MTADLGSEAGCKIGLLWRGSRAEGPYSTVRTERLKPLVSALRRLGVAVEPVVYQDDAVDELRGQLLGLDGTPPELMTRPDNRHARRHSTRPSSSAPIVQLPATAYMGIRAYEHWPQTRRQTEGPRGSRRGPWSR